MDGTTQKTIFSVCLVVQSCINFFIFDDQLELVPSLLVQLLFSLALLLFQIQKFRALFEKILQQLDRNINKAQTVAIICYCIIQLVNFTLLVVMILNEKSDQIQIEIRSVMLVIILNFLFELARFKRQWRAGLNLFIYIAYFISFWVEDNVKSIILAFTGLVLTLAYNSDVVNLQENNQEDCVLNQNHNQLDNGDLDDKGKSKSTSKKDTNLQKEDQPADSNLKIDINSQNNNNNIIQDVFSIMKDEDSKLIEQTQNEKEEKQEPLSSKLKNQNNAGNMNDFVFNNRQLAQNSQIEKKETRSQTLIELPNIHNFKSKQLIGFDGGTAKLDAETVEEQLPEAFHTIYKDIIDFLPHGIVFIDLDEKVVFKNKSAMNILSVKMKDHILPKVLSLLEKQEKQKFKEKLKQPSSASKSEQTIISVQETNINLEIDSVVNEERGGIYQQERGDYQDYQDIKADYNKELFKFHGGSPQEFLQQDTISEEYGQQTSIRLFGNGSEERDNFQRKKSEEFTEILRKNIWTNSRYRLSESNLDKLQSNLEERNFGDMEGVSGQMKNSNNDNNDQENVMENKTEGNVKFKRKSKIHETAIRNNSQLLTNLYQEMQRQQTQHENSLRPKSSSLQKRRTSKFEFMSQDFQPTSDINLEMVNSVKVSLKQTSIIKQDPENLGDDDDDQEDGLEEGLGEFEVDSNQSDIVEPEKNTQRTDQRPRTKTVITPNKKQQKSVKHELIKENNVFSFQVFDKACQKILKIRFSEITITLWKSIQLVQTAFICLVIQDITSQTENELLRHQIESKVQIITALSHNLRTPLNSSINLVSILKSKVPETLLHDFVKPIYSTNRLLLSIVNNMIDYTMFHDGNFDYQFTNFDLRSLIYECVQLYQTKTKLKKIEVNIFFDFETNRNSLMVSDKRRVQQIFLNIFDNAIKYCHRTNGFILVGVSKDATSNTFEISVKDNGRGFSKEQYKRIEREIEKYRKIHQQKDAKNLFQSLIEEKSKRGSALGLSFSSMLASGLSDKDEYLQVISQQEQGSEIKFYIDDLEAYLNQDFNYESQSNSKRNTSSQLSKISSRFSAKISSSSKFSVKSKPDSMQDVLNENYNSENLMEGSETEVVGEIKVLQNQMSIQNYTWDNTSQKNQKSQLQVHQIQESLIKTSSPLIQLQKIINQQICLVHPQILIVDDDQFNVYTLIQLLQYIKQEIVVDMAFNGKEAVDKVKERFIIQQQLEYKDNELNLDNIPDNNCLCTDRRLYRLILMDIDMPVKNGYEATQEILGFLKERQKLEDEQQKNQVVFLQETNIIACSAYVSPQEKSKAQKIGMKDYISKPIEPDIFEQTIRKLFKL